MGGCCRSSNPQTWLHIAIGMALVVLIFESYLLEMNQDVGCKKTLDLGLHSNLLYLMGNHDEQLPNTIRALFKELGPNFYRTDSIEDAEFIFTKFSNLDKVRLTTPIWKACEELRELNSHLQDLRNGKCTENKQSVFIVYYDHEIPADLNCPSNVLNIGYSTGKKTNIQHQVYLPLPLNLFSLYENRFIHTQVNTATKSLGYVRQKDGLWSQYDFNKIGATALNPISSSMHTVSFMVVWNVQMFNTRSFFESGAIPVFVDIHPSSLPFSQLLPWDKMGVFVSRGELRNINVILKTVNLDEMRSALKFSMESFLSTPRKIAEGLLSILQNMHPLTIHGTCLSSPLFSEPFPFLEDLQPIPLQIWLKWKDKNIEANAPDHNYVRFTLKQLRTLNPDWKVTIVDDQDVNEYLEQKLSTDDYALVVSMDTIDKSYVWRLLVLYHEGGAYMDITQPVNVAMSTYLRVNSTQRLFLSTRREMEFSQEAIITSPKNPMFRIVLEKYLTHFREDPSAIILTSESFLDSIVDVMCCMEYNIFTRKYAKLEYCRDIFGRSQFVDGEYFDSGKEFPHHTYFWYGSREEYAIQRRDPSSKVISLDMINSN